MQSWVRHSFGAIADRRLGIGWLFVTALIPGILAGSILLYDGYQNNRDQLEQGALQTARALSQAMDRDVAGIQGKLQILATSPYLRNGDFQTFYRQAQEILSTEGLAEAIILLDGTGQQIFNTLLPFGSALPKSGRTEMLHRTFETGRPLVSDLYIGAATRRPFVALEVPVWRDGKVIYALDMGISAERLNRLLLEQKLPEGWIAALMDSQKTIVARSRNPEQAMGKKATPDLQAKMSRNREGTMASHTIEGDPSFVAFSRSSASGWTVTVGMTRDVLYANLYRSLGFAGLTIVAFLLGGAILAWLFSRQVQDALATLGAATEAATAGDLDAQAPLTGPREIVRLADQFNRMQKARKEAEAATHAKSVFLANMSHEIRTPLHVIIGLGHLLRRDLKDPLQQGRLNQIATTSDHLLAILNDILTLSKIEAHRLVLDHGDFRLDTVLDKAMRMSEGPALEKKLKLVADVAPLARNLALNGDALRLAQVLINLCGNAIKFTDQGEVRLEVACLAEAADSVTLRFSVTDTGIGIAPRDQARVFQAFEQADSSTTRAHGGSGLGLAISQRLVGLMGSTICVDSRAGAGSTFHFDLVLPRATGRVAETTVNAAAATDFSGRHVLFADDHALSQEILFEMLEDLGCEVDVASDGAEAVACAQLHSYDLILMDMQMPKMDGIAAARAIRELPEHRDTPIIALTANAFAEDRQRCLAAGMNGHIGKPVTPGTLATALAQWLPNLAVPSDDRPLYSDELSRALTEIPGLDSGHRSWHSPEQLTDFRTLLNRFVNLHSRDMAQVCERLAAGEHDAARVVAHNLKGIAGMIGAWRVATLATELEQALRAGEDRTRVESLASACEAELAGIAAAVRSLPAAAAVTD